jgi:hypothetical protein
VCSTGDLHDGRALVLYRKSRASAQLLTRLRVNDVDISVECGRAGVTVTRDLRKKLVLDRCDAVVTPFVEPEYRVYDESHCASD